MLEPTARYPPSVVAPTSRIEIDTSSLDRAVDLSRKNEVDGDQDESEDEAPLDLKIRPSTIGRHSKPRFHGLSEFRTDPRLPDEQKKAELLRLAELYTSGANPGPPLPPSLRDQDVDSENHLPSDSACSLCGADTQSPDFRPSEHGENLCGRGTFSCQVCSKTFAVWAQYDAHKRSHQKLKQRQYPCQSCGKIFTSASNRNMHQRIHKGVRPFHCIPCGVYFRQKAHLQKHQKTQGHLQATDIWEKRKREGRAHQPDDEDSVHDDPAAQTSGQGEDLDRSEDGLSNSSNSSTENVQNSSPDVASNSHEASPTTTIVSTSGGRSRHKSSPRRKIFHVPQSEEEADSDDHRVERAVADTSDDKVLSLIEYNDVTHGYDCMHCDFSSHDLAIMKDHGRDDHLDTTGERLKCDHCQLTFSQNFHLRIHAQKHQPGDQRFKCEHCDQLFRVPNKLIKHLEETHMVCPVCGEKEADRANLLMHIEDNHVEHRLKRGYHANLLQFTPLAQLTNKVPSSMSSPFSLENRAAKMRKVDTLAETIRQKKQQLTNNNMMTNVFNGNTKTSSLSPTMTPPRKRKLDLPMLSTSFRQFSTPNKSPPEFVNSMLQLHQQPLSLSQLQNAKMSPISPDLVGRSENNNVLHMAGIKLPTKPVAGMTPPSSPTPPLYRHNDVARIHGEVSVTIVRHNDDDSGAGDEESETEETTGLDLSISKARRNEEHEVSSTATPKSSVMSAELYPRLPFAPNNPFLNSPGFPFFLPPPTVRTSDEKSIAEQLLKLTTSLPPVSVATVPSVMPSAPADIQPKVAPPSSSLSAPFSVLSAMLGHGSYQTAFPGMAPGILLSTPAPASMTTIKDVEASPPTLARPPQSESATSSGKPFSCSVCRKEFGHLSSLEAHMEHMHSGEAKHVCESCGKNFSSKSNLTAHKKIHSGERPFECAVCHKRFRQKAHLQKHETTHSSATPYHCTVCDKAFGHPSNLNTHMATHSNVRPYHCGDCGKSYKDSASFKRHRLGHTGERPYSCNNCSEAFIDSKALRRHRELVHPSESRNDAEDDSIVGEDVDAANESGDDDDLSVGHDVEGQNVGQVLDEEEEEDDDATKADEANKNASSTSAYSSFESNEDHGSDTS